MKKRPEAGDADDFAREMADVIRLEPDPRGRVRVRPATHSPRVSPSSSSTPASASSSRPRSEDDDSADGFVAHGVNRRELRKLKRAEYAPGDRLDLHRMTIAEASVLVQRFVDLAHGRHRCVCIVHGQGRHSDGQVSVLKPRVREWLRQHRAVLAYADAPRTDGGSGAVYVLLRR